jgi:hypothetical protein
MLPYNAVVLIDYHSAKIMQFGSEHAHGTKVNEHLHLNGPRERNDRSRHEFFGKVCDALEGIAQVLVVGANSSLSEFRCYVRGHRPQAAVQLVAYQVVDHPSDNELVDFARTWFSDHRLMTGIAA